MKIVMVGLGEIASVMHDYFTRDSSFEVVAFAAEAEHLASKGLSAFHGKPTVTLEAMRERYTPDKCGAFVAMGYSRLNRDRERVYGKVKAMGYELASYVSSRAIVAPGVVIGDNCAVCNDTVLERGVVLGNDVVLWGGDYFCHRDRVGDHVFCSARVAVGGLTSIGDRCFLGVNSTVGSELAIAEDTFIGGGVVITRDTKAGELYKVPTAHPMPYSSVDYCNSRNRFSRDWMPEGSSAERRG